MWAHAVGHICKYEHLQEPLGLYFVGGKYWFAPELLLELYNLGLTLGDINKSMTEEVTTLQLFKEQLISDNPSYESQINAILN